MRSRPSVRTPAADPLAELVRWLRRARRAGIHEPEAMALATADTRGRPSSRMVLLRGLDERGLVFFTNYRSRKGAELERQPQAAALFYWAPLSRQVRVEGRVRKVTETESDSYFSQRPRGARLAAWASEQSEPLRDRDRLVKRFALIRERFRGREVPRPPHWGGYRLEPRTIEFWRARPHRLHDRVLYRRGATGWRASRLAP
jgi:pyridoxamine 5'-phosphate oxidase